MDENFNSIVFFDSECNFCKSMISYLASMDKDALLRFAPLNGETAKTHLKEILPGFQTLNTVVFLTEDSGKPKIYLYAKAVFKVLDSLGGTYRCIGWLHHLPSILIDPIYRLIARNRRAFKFKGELEGKDPRFLP